VSDRLGCDGFEVLALSASGLLLAEPLSGRHAGRRFAWRWARAFDFVIVRSVFARTCFDARSTGFEAGTVAAARANFAVQPGLSHTHAGPTTPSIRNRSLNSIPWPQLGHAVVSPFFGRVTPRRSDFRACPI
jgi:hypothetical protein